MSKYINYLILCCTLLLYCCGEHNAIPAKRNQTINNSNIKLNDEEQKFNNITKFNIIKTGLDAIIACVENERKEHEENMKRIIDKKHLKKK